MIHPMDESGQSDPWIIKVVKSAGDNLLTPVAFGAAKGG
ncbi:hypothetical protein D1BOALGB6SA_10819 [Olavius sp. associated proteobacterium Delta 1]|nr:hypothetical protein D1BOALGB6SA_10819 [Olavius sp. associated proteobacterium Delta 1]